MTSLRQGFPTKSHLIVMVASASIMGCVSLYPWTAPRLDDADPRMATEAVRARDKCWNELAARNPRVNAAYNEKQVEPVNSILREFGQCLSSFGYKVSYPRNEGAVAVAQIGGGTLANAPQTLEDRRACWLMAEREFPYDTPIESLTFFNHPNATLFSVARGIESREWRETVKAIRQKRLGHCLESRGHVVTYVPAKNRRGAIGAHITSVKYSERGNRYDLHHRECQQRSEDQYPGETWDGSVFEGQQRIWGQCMAAFGYEVSYGPSYGGI
jgi:hypothetical protein